MSAGSGTAAYGFSATIPEGRLNGLRRNPQVKYVEIDGIADVSYRGCEGLSIDTQVIEFRDAGNGAR